MTQPPNLYWRNVVRSGFTRFRATSQDLEGDFLRHVEQLYFQEKQKDRELPADAPERKSVPLGLYVLAVALLTYGRLDVIKDLLGNLPPGRHPARSLARSVSTLIPLRAGLDPLKDPDATLDWINEHRSRLRWHEEEGRFYLDER
jgi:hypothetical protein